MKIQYQQTVSGGCVFYALAHLLQDESLLKYVVPGQGNNPIEANKALEKEGHDAYLVPLLVMNTRVKKHSRIRDASVFDLTPDNDEQREFFKRYSRLFFCTVYLKKLKRHHAIGLIQDCYSGQFYTVDSTEKHVRSYTDPTIMLKFYHFCDLWVFRNDTKQKNDNESLYHKKWLHSTLISDYAGYKKD